MLDSIQTVKSLTKQKTINDKDVEQFKSFYKTERMNVAEEDDNLTKMMFKMKSLDKLSKESPDDLIEVMQSYSEENDSMSFNELLLNTYDC